MTSTTSSSGGGREARPDTVETLLRDLEDIERDVVANRAKLHATLGRMDRIERDLDYLSPSSAASKIMGRLHDHPVLKTVRQRRTAAREQWMGDVGDAARQTIALDDARALHAHFEELRARHHDGWKVPPLDPIVPGRHWVTVYGVKLVIEDRAPMLGEYQPRPGLGRAKGLWEIAHEMLPAGTTIDRRACVNVPAMPHPGRLVQQAKQWLATALDAPHYIAVLTADDLPEHEHPPPPFSDEPGWRSVHAFTAAAIPGKTSYIVFRPAPGLPAGWLHPDREGEWHERGHIHDLAHLAGVGPISWNLEPDAQVEVRVLTARATGRVEIRDGQAAEIFEVTR